MKSEHVRRAVERSRAARLAAFERRLAPQRLDQRVVRVLVVLPQAIQVTITT